MSDDSDNDSGEEYENLNDDPSNDLELSLYEHMNAPAFVAQGEVKSYHVKENSAEIYADHASDYSISVQRLLWIDGHEKTQKYAKDAATGKQVVKEVKQESTLVVLKILLKSREPDQKFRWMKATLSLEDASGGKDHPQVQAWAPLRTEKRWNATVGHHETTNRVEVGLQGGFSGAQISGGASREGSISWDQTCFDEGNSNEELKDGKRNGVTWFVKQNRLEDQGVTRELWVSALFRRSSQNPYLVNFNMYAQAGRLQEFKSKTMRFFGGKPGTTKPFPVTPGKDVCNYEGEYIIGCIDRDDLGKLREKELNTSLMVAWGPDYRITSPLTIGTQEEGTAGRPEVAAASNRRGSDQPDVQLCLNCLSGRLAGWYNPNMTSANIDNARLVALEGRVAQTEARVAAQDGLILQLQRELMTKDIQIAKMDAAFSQLAIGQARNV
ncbi:hypothetical protein B0T17DRAFT_125067 [Bombardia bombarda]|uniref:Uncharacterized protein n=1 Tax=Bombardia bombarda TaxID=252184 RepID=A0AA39T0U5_9PEZI|nr:hypothetical protein B0T17DRAFT_125067 [Bombardia bombarda]